MDEINREINEYLENRFFEYFSKTRLLHNDYWYIWAKSGLLDYVCQKLRDKYTIPPLNYEEDCANIEVTINDRDIVSFEAHRFYDSWDKKDEFNEVLKGLIHQLRLHRGAFSMLFDKVFYDTPLDPNYEWEGIDSAAIGINPNDQNILTEGFTAKEIKKIKREFKRVFHKKKLDSKEEQVIDSWCEQLRRKTRPPRSKEEIYRVIEKMKRYKHMGEGRSDKSGYGIVRQTSGVIAGEIVKELPDEELRDIDYSNSWFRMTAKDYSDRFPILKDFIADFQKSIT